MKNDMASPIPTKGSTVESHDPKERTISDAVSVKPASPPPTCSDSRLEHQKKAEIETAEGERNSDFNQESILGLPEASEGAYVHHHILDL